MKIYALLATATLAVAANAALLYDNGPMVTHPGAGPGGVDVSMASAVPNSGGSNTTNVIWRADDFAISDPAWIVDSATFYSYDSLQTAPRWVDAHIEIRAGAITGPTVATAPATWTYSGVNRVFNGAANLSNVDRRLFAFTANFGGVNLAAGNYFAVFNAWNNVGNTWVPYVMDPNPANVNDPITRVGNSLVSVDSGVNWTAATVTTGGWNQVPEVPFQINGSAVPEPTTMAFLGLGALAAIRRARKNSK